MGEFNVTHLTVSVVNKLECGKIPIPAATVTLLGRQHVETSWCRHSNLSFPLHGVMWIPSNTRFLRTKQVNSPNGISISSAIFVGLTVETNRQTDRQTDHATLFAATDYI